MVQTISVTPMYYNEFRKIGIDAPHLHVGNKKVICPKCLERKGHTKDKDLSINYESGLYKCHSVKCDFQGSVQRLRKQYTRPKKRNTTNLSTKVVRYFENRGISQQTLTKAGISEDERGNIEFNYYRGETLINVKTRFALKDGKKSFKQHTGAEKIVYNLNSLKGKTKGIFVEGETDVLSFMEAGVGSQYGIISVDQGAGQKGSVLGNKLECLRNCAIDIDKIEEWYICTDNDEAGIYLKEELVRRLGQHKCKIVQLSKGCKDANDVIKNLNGQSKETRLEALRFALKSAKQVPLEGVHTLDEDTMSIMEYQYIHGRKKGVTTHIPLMDNIFTFLQGDITLVTGIPGDGKSQFVRLLMVIKSKFDNWKWACYVPEDFPTDFFFEDLCHTYLGKPTDKDTSTEQRATLEEYRQAMLWVREHFFLIYPEVDKKTGEFPLPTNEWINQRINFLKLKYGVNAYFKDPWNKIHHDFHQREDQYLAKELSKEKFFASQYAAALYVAHPKTMRKNKEGKLQEVGPYDLSGGAMFNNMMDNILLVVRPNRWDNASDKMVNIKSLKIKKQKLVGKLGTAPLFFDPNKMRYYEQGTDYCPLDTKLAQAVDDTFIEFDETGADLPF